MSLKVKISFNFVFVFQVAENTDFQGSGSGSGNFEDDEELLSENNIRIDVITKEKPVSNGNVDEIDGSGGSDETNSREQIGEENGANILGLDISKLLLVFIVLYP